MTHTPGPWYYWSYQDADGDPRIDYQATVFTTHCFHFEKPANEYVGIEVGGRNDAERASNARLIAAAPDLLEALDLILPLAKGYVAIHKVPSTQEWLRAAEAAIAKARERLEKRR